MSAISNEFPRCTFKDSLAIQSERVGPNTRGIVASSQRTLPQRLVSEGGNIIDEVQIKYLRDSRSFNSFSNGVDESNSYL